MEAFITYRKRLTFPDTIEGAPEDMDTTGFGRLVDIIAAGKGRTCVLRGNEATLHPDFCQLVTMTLKKQLVPLVETCGLVLPDTLAFIQEKQLPLLLRLYQPKYCPADEAEEIRQTVRTIVESGTNQISTIAITKATEGPPQFALDFLKEIPLPEITFRILQPDNLETLRPYMEWLTAEILALTEAGIRCNVDCGIPPCTYTDEAYGKLAKLAIKHGRCLPKPGVRPDMRVYHCFQMIQSPGATLHMFKRRPQILDYFFDRYNGLQWDLKNYPDCIPCPCLRSLSCGGLCMAVKEKRLTEELAAKQNVLAETEDLEALIRAGIIAYQLGRYPESMEYLTEARRVDPSRPDIHLSLARALWQSENYTDSEEEFRKAARLLPDGRQALAELAGRFEAKGSSFKARRIMEELRRMPQPEPVSQHM